jgi:hypothetical protein
MEQPEDQKYRIHLITRDPFDPRDEKLEVNPNEGAHYIVQFVKPLTIEEQRQLKVKYDLRLKDYVPNFAFLEWMEPQTWKALTQDKLYRASVRYKARDKISPHLIHPSDGKAPHLRAVLFPESDYREIIEVINKLISQPMFSEASAESVDENDYGQAKAHQIKVIDDRKSGGDLQVVFAALPEELLGALAQREEVLWIEEVAKRVLDETPLSDSPPAGMIQSGVLGRLPLWDRGIRGEGQVIGVTDSPVGLDNCMFSDPDANSVGPTHRKVVGNRQGQFSSDLHGRRVAALAAGFNSDPSATSHRRGIAWQAKLSLDEVESDSFSFLSILQRQASDTAFIHTNSWHDDSNSAYNQTARDVDIFVSENEKHFVCGSSGNNGERLGAPGIAKNALCVSASKQTRLGGDVGDGVTGPVSHNDLRLKPEICAPGCRIQTADIRNCDTSSIPGCASSWATAIIAGAAALVRQYYAEGWYPSGAKSAPDGFTPSGALIKATLLNSTVDISEVEGYPSNREGWGLVRLTNTLFFADEGSHKLFVRDVLNADGLSMGESRTYTIDVRDDSRLLKITLVWSDCQSLPSVIPLLVNNLDLVVTSPDGRIFLGNNFSLNGISTEGGAADIINNVEMVIRDQNLTGAWTIQVSCATANNSTKRQGYALVVTAALA